MSQRVINYVRGGGTAILATHFSSFVRPPDMNRWFRESWGLPWQTGDYHRTTVHLNTKCHWTRAGLPEHYSQKAVFLQDVSKDGAVYLASESSRTESHVFAPESVSQEQTPVVFAQVGEGWLGYIGDVNNEVASQKVLLAMCGL